MLSGCSPDQNAAEDNTKAEQLRADTIPPQDSSSTTALSNDKVGSLKMKMFKQVSGFPFIHDTTEFISQLRQAFHLDVHESPVQKATEEITVYKKVKMYGSSKNYYFIEYDWKVGSNADYPWKYQVLLTSEGKHVKTFAGYRFDFLTIFPGENPFLVIVRSTARGNGGHEIYKGSEETVENVYEGYYDHRVQTFAAGEHMWTFRPNELRLSVIDENKDGLNDIVFTGKKLWLGKYTADSFWYDVENHKPFTVNNPGSIEPVRYVFLYDRKTGHFK